MKQFILILSLILTGCGTSGCGSSPSSSSSSTTVATTAPVPNASGELLATVDFAAGGNISASALQLATNDPLSQFASIAIPAGALSKSIDVKIFETGSLAIQIAPSEFGVTEIKKAGPALVIQGDSTALKSEITVSVPYSSSASLNLADEQFAVLALSGNNLEIFVGDQLTIGSKTIGVKVKNFGAFQVVKYSGVVQQQKATVQISDANLKTVVAAAEPVVTPTPAITVQSPTPAAIPVVVAPTPTPTPTPAATLFDGTWTYEEPAAADLYTFIRTTVISNNNINTTLITYNHAGMHITTTVTSGTLVIGNTLASGATLMDLNITSVIATPHNSEGIALLDIDYFKDGIYSKKTWIVGVGQNIKEENQNIYTIAQVVAGSLVFGADDATYTYNGTTPALRHTQLSTPDQWHFPYVWL